jgi:hypothetical protein
MHWLTGALVALFLLHGTPAAPPAEKAQPAAEAANAPSAGELLKTADEIVKQVSALRQLSVRGPIKRGVLTREAILAKLREQIDRQYTGDEMKTLEALLKALGLLPANVDFEKIQMDLLMEQVAGFYDPYGKQLYIPDWLPLVMQAPALAHEIAHALQDQHFDLKKFIAFQVKDQSDRQLARHALAEGDGTGVMLEYSFHKDLSALPDMSQMMAAAVTGESPLGPKMPVLEHAPEYLKQSLLFPYVGGLGFVQYVRKRYPWSKIDEAYRHAPDSTEQIIHPEKFFAHEPPVWIKAKQLRMLGGGKKPVHEDTMGELQIRLFLSIVGGAKNADDAAAGWGGDRIVAYRAPSGEGYQIVWLTDWDTEADAIEFAQAAKPAVEKIHGFLSEPRGKQVVLLVGIDPALRDQVVEEVLRSWKSGKAPAA